MKLGMLSTRLSLLLLASCSVGIGHAADVDPFDGQWHFDAALYAWLPTIHGTLQYGLPPGSVILPGGTAEATVSPSSYIGDVKFAAMLYGQARKGDAALFTDFVYADLGNSSTRIRDLTGPFGRVTVPANLSAGLDLHALAWTFGASYTGVRGSGGTLDLAVGFRYFEMSSELKWTFTVPGIVPRAGNAGNSAELWDGVLGFYGRINLDRQARWFIPYYLDAGAGTQSNWTSMAFGGLGYRFDWGSLVAGYKNLYYSQSGNRAIQSLNMGGALLGVDFRW